MQNNYFSYNLNKKNNIILVSLSVVVSVIVFFTIGFILFAERWENARLIGGENGYSDIPTLDKNGLNYFVVTKNQTINDNVTTLEQEDALFFDTGKNIGN